jgi:hypothetical protein
MPSEKPETRCSGNRPSFTKPTPQHGSRRDSLTSRNILPSSISRPQVFAGNTWRVSKTTLVRLSNNSESWSSIWKSGDSVRGAIPLRRSQGGELSRTAHHERIVRQLENSVSDRPEVYPPAAAPEATRVSKGEWNKSELSDSPLLRISSPEAPVGQEIKGQCSRQISTKPGWGL